MHVLVTGASSGIGKALVSHLKKLGISVTGAARQVDQVDTEAIVFTEENLVNYILEKQPDVVIHCAGFGWYGEAIFMPQEQMTSMFNLHVLLVTKLACALKDMAVISGKKPILMVVSSLAGQMPTPGMAIYGASKAAATSLCQALNFELQPYGVLVLVSCPGMVKTAFAERAAKRKFVYPRATMSAEKAARLIWQAVVKRKEKTIIDFRYKILNILIPFIPKHFLRKKIYKSVINR